MYFWNRSGLKKKMTETAKRLVDLSVRLHFGQRAALSEFEARENRSRLRAHLVRERSTALAESRKRRDAFTCQICRINFLTLYGAALGAGFAEAHHIVHLRDRRLAGPTRPRDLRTVCANCHRMLHRTKSGAKGFAAVRRAFTGQWPKKKGH